MKKLTDVNIAENIEKNNIIIVPTQIKKKIKDALTHINEINKDFKKTKELLSTIVETFLVAKDEDLVDWELNEDYDFVPKKNN